MVGRFDFGERGSLGGASLKEAVGERTADALMEEHKEQGGAGSLVSETIGIAPAVAFEQGVGFQLAQVIAELGEGVTFGAEAEAGKNRLMDVAGPPSQDLGAACSSTSIRRSMRVSWSLMPGILPQPRGMGRARR
jgi:hypothetical protein